MARLVCYYRHKRFVSLGDDLLHYHTVSYPENLVLYQWAFILRVPGNSSHVLFQIILGVDAKLKKLHRIYLRNVRSKGFYFHRASQFCQRSHWVSVSSRLRSRSCIQARTHNFASFHIVKEIFRCNGFFFVATRISVANSLLNDFIEVNAWFFWQKRRV